MANLLGVSITQTLFTIATLLAIVGGAAGLFKLLGPDRMKMNLEAEEIARERAERERAKAEERHEEAREEIHALKSQLSVEMAKHDFTKVLESQSKVWQAVEANQEAIRLQGIAMKNLLDPGHRREELGIDSLNENIVRSMEHGEKTVLEAVARITEQGVAAEARLTSQHQAILAAVENLVEKIGHLAEGGTNGDPA